MFKSSFKLFSLLLLILTIQQKVTCLDGDVDPAFTAGPLKLGYVRASVIQPDGKIIVGGNFLGVNGVASSSVVRLNSDGSIDKSFNPPFIYGTSSGTVYSLSLQPDGKIIVGGGAIIVNGHSRSGVFRLNSDGSSDDAFNQGEGAISGDVFATAIQPDGKILIGGGFSEYNGAFIFNFARINADGSWDSSFRPFVSSDSGEGVQSIAFQGDKIIIGGNFSSVAQTSVAGIARLNMDGTLDTSFNVSFVSNSLVIRGVSVQPDNRILICGNFSQVNNVARSKLARLNSNGSLDTGFTADIPFAVNNPWRIKTFSDGKIVVIGFFNQLNGVTQSNISKLNSNGTLDTSFNAATDGAIYDVIPTVFPVIVGGFSKVNNQDAFGISRLTNTGSIDPNFHAGEGVNGDVRAITVQPDGKILVGGEFLQFHNTLRSGIGRLNEDGTLDTTFNPGTGVGTSTGYRINDIAVSNDSKIAAAGNFFTFNGTNRRMIVLLNSDGTIDNSFNPDFTQSGEIKKVAFYPGNKVLILGSFRFGSETQTTNIAMLNADGSRDTSFMPVFSTGGINSVFVPPDGKIMVGGGFTTVNGVQKKALVRLNPDGSIDNDFEVNAPDYNILNVVQIFVQPNGKIVVSGSFQKIVNNIPIPLSLLRFNHNGARDEEFNLIEAPGQRYQTEFTVQSDGKILIVLNDGSGGISRRGVVRLKLNGSLDSSFNLTQKGVNPSESLAALALQNNKILVGGKFTSYSDNPRLSLVRLNNSLQTVSTVFDFDGDGRTDIGIFRPTPGEWWYQKSSDNSVPAVQFGTATDKIVPADFTGDGKTDIAFWRESTGEWFVLRSEDNSFYAFPFGTAGDIPVPGDFDADGKSDAAVFRPSNSTWYMLLSSTGTINIQQFGVSEDLPVVSDYDGDGKDDIAVFRPSVSEWWILRSTAGLTAVQFGQAGDKTVQGDYTGDGKADIAFWRPSTGEWFVLRSEDNSFYAFPFGSSGDIAVPGDYDGDGKSDAAVFRPANTTWYLQRSTSGFTAIQFGTTGDQPIPNSYVRN